MAPWFHVQSVILLHTVYSLYVTTVYTDFTNSPLQSVVTKRPLVSKPKPRPQV